MMEAEKSSRTLVNFYHTTLRYKQEDSHLHCHGRENLKTYLANLTFYETQSNRTDSPKRPIGLLYMMHTLLQSVTSVINVFQM